MPRHESKELSVKNPYHISRNRYLELYYFCRQYKEWKHEYSNLLLCHAITYEEHIKGSDIPDYTSDIAIKKKELSSKIELVDNTLQETDPDLAIYLFKNIVEEETYTYISSHYPVPCCEKTFYKIRRKFFWLLAKKR